MSKESQKKYFMLNIALKTLAVIIVSQAFLSLIVGLGWRPSETNPILKNCEYGSAFELLDPSSKQGGNNFEYVTLNIKLFCPDILNKKGEIFYLTK